MPNDQPDTVICHLFADHGAESEPLSRYGEVHRYTIDPEPNPYCESTTQMDLLESEPDIDADLVVAHPKCTKWSDMPNVDPDDHENQIPRARELCQQISDHYIIENKPRAPLRDPTKLTGQMFGLPIKYERAFETSFRVRSPPRERTLQEKTVSPYFYSDRSTEWWKSIKGYHGDYPKQHLSKNALPSVYIDCLVRSWLRATNELDTQEVQDNNSPAPREVTDDQALLTEVESRN